MELATIALGVMALACPLMMGLMMWMMGKNMSSHTADMAGSDRLLARPEERLAALRAQRDLIEAEITELNQLAELQAHRDALLNEQAAVIEDMAAR